MEKIAVKHDGKVIGFVFECSLTGWNYVFGKLSQRRYFSFGGIKSKDAAIEKLTTSHVNTKRAFTESVSK